MKLVFNRKSLMVVYYLLLLVVFFFLMRPNVGLPLSFRLIIMAMVFIPVFIDVESLPFAVVCFFGVSSTSFTDILPSTTYYYLLITLLFYLLFRKKSKFVIYALLVFAYYFVMSLFHFDFLDSLSWFFIMILMADMIENKEGLTRLFYAFIVISIFLSLLYLLHMGEFVKVYGRQAEGMERSGWINANTFGAAIGAGAVLCNAYITRIIDLPRSAPLNVISVITIVLSFLVLILNASRGAFFAFVIPSFFMFLISKTKLWVKILIATASVLIVVWIVKNNMFELLFARMEEESFATGGGRTYIWQNKLSLFFVEDNLVHLVFGLGQTGCNDLGGFFSTHNDIVTAFIGYGLVGFVLFIYFVFVYPLQRASKRNKLVVSTFLTYVLIECCVLEPFFRGKIIVMMFYIFTLKYAMIFSDSSIINTQKEQ